MYERLHLYISQSAIKNIDRFFDQSNGDKPYHRILRLFLGEKRYEIEVLYRFPNVMDEITFKFDRLYIVIPRMQSQQFNGCILHFSEEVRDRGFKVVRPYE